MEFFLPGDKEPLYSGDRIPSHLSKFAIPGAQRRYTRFEEGEILTQVLLGNDFSIWVHRFFIQQKITLYPFTKNNLLTLLYMVEGNIEAVLKGHGMMLLEENRYNLLYVPGQVKHEGTFQPRNYYSVHINFHPEHLLPVARQYPVFGSMLAKAEKGLRNGERHFSAIISPNIKALLEEMLHNELQPAERTLFLESRIRDLLRKYVHDFAVQQQRTGITDSQAKLLKEIESFIEGNLHKDLSVTSIAAHFRISRSWLQQLSKNHYQQGIHQLVMKKRMEAASELLLTTRKSVSEIVLLVSDITFAAFSASFRQYFGISPLEYRKHKGQKP